MSNGALAEKVKAALPENTIGRYDLLPVFADAALFDDIVLDLCQPFHGEVDVVVSPEAMGWILGAAMARKLGAGFVGVRKPDKLPYASQDVLTTDFVDYTGRSRQLAVPRKTLLEGKRVLIADEWVETGTQVRALLNLVNTLGGQTVGIATIGLDINNGTRGWVERGFVHYVGSEI